MAIFQGHRLNKQNISLMYRYLCLVSWSKVLIIKVEEQLPLLLYKGGSSICNFNFSHFPKWILQMLTKIVCSVKKKRPLLLSAIEHLQFKLYIISGMTIFGFNNPNIIFHKKMLETQI